jgi:hypothetical protein
MTDAAESIVEIPATAAIVPQFCSAINRADLKGGRTGLKHGAASP